YWDGGLVSNTPLTHVLDRQDAETLIFQVDLFPAADELPRTITDVLAREKEIRFSSRTRAVSDERMRLRQERQMVCRLLSKLPPEL
ncbi:patatin-like phospholipase family protein, partial [Escherichia coli]|nr:patatin-like phospholipase family protein [Escherichia coli]